MLRVILYASGSPLSLAALDALHGVARVVAVVMPASRYFLQRLRLRRWTDEFRERATQLGISLVNQGTDSEFSEPVDLICVAAYPRLLHRSTFARARVGAVNIHASLLPRHRGPDPLFWTYFHDDREAGVTVHWIADGVDDGDVIEQRRIEVERGLAGLELYYRLAHLGGGLLAHAICQIESGTASRTPQDESLATHEPSPSRLTWRIEYDTWSAERLWHFLRGVEHRDTFTLPDGDRRPHVIGAVRDFQIRPHSIPAGTITDQEAFTADGSVRWSRAPLRRRVLQFLRPSPSRGKRAAVERSENRSPEPS